MPESNETFVGRTAEMAELRKALQQARQHRQPEFVLVQGEMGAGKTTLVEHFLTEESARDASLLIGRGKCTFEDQTNGLVPFSQVLDSLARPGLQGRTANEWLGVFKEVAPLWIDVFTAGLGTAIIKTVTEAGKLARQRTYTQMNVFQQFETALKRLVGQQPAIVYIDDLHWADESSLHLLKYLAQHYQSGAILFICAYRQVHAIETGANAGVFREVYHSLTQRKAVELNLSQGIEISDYVAQRFPGHALPTELLKRAEEITDGHPLFVRELFALWQDTGVIGLGLDANGRPVWTQQKEPDVAQFSMRLDAALDERLRLMDERLRDVLTWAAVQGEEFVAQIIAQAYHQDEYRVFEALETLERRYNMVRFKGMREINAAFLDSYQFAHAFYCDLVYERLGKPRRRIMHREVGASIENLRSAAPQVAGQLARHFEAAGQWLKAAEYALAAARQEQAGYHWAEGEKQCQFGLDALRNADSETHAVRLRLDLLECSGDGSYEVGNYELADQCYRAALALAESIPGAQQAAAHLCVKLGDVCEYEGKYEEAMQLADHGLKILAVSDEPFGEVTVRLRWLQAMMQGRFGDGQTAISALHQLTLDAVDAPLTFKSPRTMAQVYNSLAVLLTEVGRYSEAINALNQSLEWAEKGADQPYITGLQLNMAYILLEMGDLDKSQTWIDKWQCVASDLGLGDSLIYTRAMAAEIALARGKVQEALTGLTSVQKEAEEANSRWYLSHIYTTLALAHTAAADLTAAEAAARSALSLAEAMKYRWEWAYAFDALAQVEIAQRNWDAAEQHFQQAFEMHHNAGHRHYAARVQVHYAAMLIQLGRSEEAARLLGEAEAALRELALDREAEQARQLLAACTTPETTGGSDPA